MQSRFDPWSSETPDGRIPYTIDGTVVGHLHRRSWQWACSDADCRLHCFAAAPLDPVPPTGPHEPVIGALARLQGWYRQQRQAVLMLDNPDEALGAARITAAQGVRLIGIRSDADRACWDAALMAGLPLYGVYGDVCCEVDRTDASAVIEAMNYGAYTSGDGVHLVDFTEDATGVRWHLAEPDGAAVGVVIAGGLEAATIEGAAGSWRDTGREGYVRLEMRQGDRRRFSQPRMVAKRAMTAGEWGR
ncbi:MAG: hypothetical protein ACOCXA_06085 [Planctomycetota bacterium]